MIKILSFPEVTDAELTGFLQNVIYNRFAMWPNATKSATENYLKNELKRYPGEINCVSFRGEILALLASNDQEWDSKYFGFKCNRIDYMLVHSQFDEKTVERSLLKLLALYQKKLSAKRVSFSSLSVDSDNRIFGKTLQKAKYKFILSWLDGFIPASKSQLIESSESFDFGLIQKVEVSHFQKIASSDFFRGGRFFLDPRFDQKKVLNMYSELVENSYLNQSILLVCRYNHKAAGMVICQKIKCYDSFANLTVAPLRLLIVDPEFRKKKVAKSLFQYSIQYLSDLADIITTGIEVHNVPSLNLHANAGFKFNYVHNVYHLWLS